MLKETNIIYFLNLRRIGKSFTIFKNKFVILPR